MVGLIAEQEVNIHATWELSNLLAYLMLKAEDKNVIDTALVLLDSQIDEWSPTWNILYGFKKTFAKNLADTLNQWLSRDDLKSPSKELIIQSMRYIKWFVNKHKKDWTLDNIRIEDCKYFFTWAILPYYDEVNWQVLVSFIGDVFKAARDNLEFREWPDPADYFQ